MDSKHPDAPPSSLSGLQYVLELGEELLFIAQKALTDEPETHRILESQKSVILKKLQSIFNCQAVVWFPEELQRRFLRNQLTNLYCGINISTEREMFTMLFYGADGNIEHVRVLESFFNL